MKIRHTSNFCSRLPHLLHSRRLLTPALIALWLGACGGGSGSTDSPLPGSGPSALTLGGSVGDGPIIGALITVHDAEGQLVASTRSDAQAKYTLSLDPEVKFPLQLRAEGGLDLVSDVAPDFTLRAVVLEPGERWAHLSPFSTAITAAADAAPDGPTAANLAAARSVVLRYLNFGWDSEAVPDPVHSPIPAAAASGVVKASEALAETLRRATASLRLTHSGITHEVVLETIASDLLDGAIDGVGENADARIAATWHMSAAQVLSEVLVNDLHVNEAPATDKLEAAVKIAFPESTSALADIVLTEMLIQQAQTTFVAADQVLPNAGLTDLPRRTELPQQPRAADLNKLLPSGLRDTLAPAARRVIEEDALVEAVNRVVRAAAQADGTYKGGDFDSTLRVSTAADRSGATPLQGQLLSGNVYIFTDLALEAGTVKFYLNDPFMAGSPLQVENIAPHDLAGTGDDNAALPYATAKLSDGMHTLSAHITLADGRQQLSHATFSVNNAVQGAPVLQLAWNPVDNLLGYEVFYGNAPDTVDMLLFNLPVNGGNIDPAAPVVSIDPVYDLDVRQGENSPVCFTVRAYNAQGHSGNAKPVCTTL